MRSFSVSLAGADRTIFFYESETDKSPFLLWVKSQGLKPVSVDTEANGLDPYADGFRLRLVQFGDRDAAWVIPYRQDTYAIIAEALSIASGYIIHNASYDLKVLDAAGLVELNEAWRKTADTRIMAHLIDPRGINEGGNGLKLENLAEAYFCDDAERYQRELFAAFKSAGWKKDQGYGLISAEDPIYIRYAGWDALLTAWLFECLAPLVRTRFTELSAFEHEVARIVCNFERRGMLVDRKYAESLIPYYGEIQAKAILTAKTFGINKLAGKEVPEVLEALGAVLVERTPGGKPKVDKKVLEALVANNEGTPLAEVAEAIIIGKNASKWATSYVKNTLIRLDGNGRVHPQIKALEARTARMSVSEPPLQQLPSGDWRVRRMFIAEPEHVYFSVDYSQVELRVLAALSREPTMLAAIANGQDLHDTTAELLYGPEFTKAQRKLAKNTNFGEVFGGGAVTLARQAGVSIAEAQHAKRLFKSSYPAITRYSYGLREGAEFGKAAVVTPSGRELPLDRDRLYSATNYVVQSTARDVLCQALIDLDSAGLSQYVVLPIHDEVLGQAKVSEAEAVVREIERVMTMDFLELVELKAQGEILGSSWGSGYGAPE